MNARRHYDRAARVYGFERTVAGVLAWTNGSDHRTITPAELSAAIERSRTVYTPPPRRVETIK